MKKIHLILTGLSLTIILLSLNRLTPWTQGYLQPFDFLRYMDLFAMIPIPLFSVLLYWLLRNEILYDHPFRRTLLYTILNLLLITGIYFFAAGSGDHEVTNYLNLRFCNVGKTDSPICNIIDYNDDVFSHYIYYIGFVLLNIPLMLFEYHLPRKKEATKKDLILVSINGLFIALGIFANLAFEEAIIDLIVFGSVMLLSLYLLYRQNFKVAKLPVTFYFAVSYTVGVAGTILYKLATNTPF
ncbi:hypothetical protein HYW54_04675 [Candidatus Gottesmanbacteria bacterium]|nr:hypothetical protein [Candidatus Gottesmanbacteria bacterium]